MKSMRRDLRQRRALSFERRGTLLIAFSVRLPAYRRKRWHQEVYDVSVFKFANARSLSPSNCQLQYSLRSGGRGE